MKVLAVATTHRADELQVADAVFDNVAQILSMLKTSSRSLAIDPSAARLRVERAGDGDRS
jgi:hypothetical protein